MDEGIKTPVLGAAASSRPPAVAGLALGTGATHPESEQSGLWRGVRGQEPGEASLRLDFFFPDWGFSGTGQGAAGVRARMRVEWDGGLDLKVHLLPRSGVCVVWAGAQQTVARRLGSPREGGVCAQSSP